MNNRTFDYFSCCSDRIRTYTDSETDPHVRKKRKGIPEWNGRRRCEGERECRQRGQLSTQMQKDRMAR